jgi:hypothetical protein
VGIEMGTVDRNLLPGSAIAATASASFNVGASLICSVGASDGLFASDTKCYLRSCTRFSLHSAHSHNSEILNSRSTSY